MTERLEADGGRLAAEALRAHDVDTVFTLSGGHLFPLYDGCVKTGIRLVDTRHEQTAAFAAEGWAKVTRRVGRRRADRRPGRHERRERDHVRAAQRLAGAGDRRTGAAGPRWGAGSLQELDHVPIVASVTKQAATAFVAEAIPGPVDSALARRAARRTAARRSSTSRSTRGARARSTLPDPPRADELAGDRARSRRGGGRCRARPRSRPAGR